MAYSAGFINGGFTRIPHLISKDLMKGKFCGQKISYLERKIIDCIILHQLGYDKKINIDAKLIIKNIDCNTNKIYTELKKMREKEIIKKTDNNYSICLIYYHLLSKI